MMLFILVYLVINSLINLHKKSAKQSKTLYINNTIIKKKNLIYNQTRGSMSLSSSMFYIPLFVILMPNVYNIYTALVLTDVRDTFSFVGVAENCCHLICILLFSSFRLLWISIYKPQFIISEY